MKRIFWILGFALNISLLPSAHALKPGGHVKASLVSEVTSIRPGTPFWVAVRLEMQTHWHTYWKNAGESGAPTQVEWTLPAGFKAGEIKWPAPRRIELPPVLSYGYENEVLLLTQISPPTVLKANSPIKLSAHVDWLECEVTCIPGQADVFLTLSIRDEASTVNPLWQEKFSQTRFEWPLEKSEWTLQAFDYKDRYQISLIPPANAERISDLTFYAEDPGVIQYAAAQKFAKKTGQYTLDVFKTDTTTETAKMLTGVLVTTNGWRGEDSEKALAVSLPIEAPPTTTASLSLFAALGLAFLGGLILNLMPCVLPVLSIKILSFIKQAEEGSFSAFRHGLFFAAGVLVSFWILAGLLLFLRAGGNQLGWGFQLQSPTFIMALIVLFFIFALNLFGLFEIGTSLTRLAGFSQGRTGFGASFLSGVLATIVATPCTAPFMGSALGFALTQPPPVAILVFTFLALGMAAPYVILSSNPALLKFVPRPGPWMETFKKIMGFLFMATVLWLLWVLNQQISFHRDTPLPGKNLAAGIVWEPYSEERVTELRHQGRSVFVDFTAAWCLTCQVNERLTLQSQSVIDALKQKNVATLKADWTSRDEKIAKKLEEFGRSGVPFYVIYPANLATEPITLPEIITPQIVLKKLEEI